MMIAEASLFTIGLLQTARPATTCNTVLHLLNGGR